MCENPLQDLNLQLWACLPETAVAKIIKRFASDTGRLNRKSSSSAVVAPARWDAVRTANLSLAGVRPNDDVGRVPVSKMSTRGLKASRPPPMGSNPAAELLLRQANDSLWNAQEHAPKDFPRQIFADESCGIVSSQRRFRAITELEEAWKERRWAPLHSFQSDHCFAKNWTFLRRCTIFEPPLPPIRHVPVPGII
jgi:hypothetical protein